MMDGDSSEEERRLLRHPELGHDLKDFLHIQNYYKKEEHRDPSVTEIRVLHTYWSGLIAAIPPQSLKCKLYGRRHREPMEETYKQYLADRSDL